MSVLRESLRDDQLIDYLLGTLPEDAAQRVEEESVVHDDVAERLQVVEQELVDAYARGTLPAHQRGPFEAFYRATPARREKVALAERFLAAVDTAAEPVPAIMEPMRAQPIRPARHSWTLAAAAILVLATGMLLVQEVRQGHELAGVRERLAFAESRAARTSNQLAEQQRAMRAERQTVAESHTAAAPAVALLLLPQTRGLDVAPVLSVPVGATVLVLDLKIDALAPVRFTASLRDPATNRVVWRSAPQTVDRTRRPAVVRVRVPATLLKAQHYALNLYALGPGEPEFAGSYTFEVNRQ